MERGVKSVLTKSDLNFRNIGPIFKIWKRADTVKNKS